MFGGCCFTSSFSAWSDISHYSYPSTSKTVQGFTAKFLHLPCRVSVSLCLARADRLGGQPRSQLCWNTVCTDTRWDTSPSWQQLCSELTGFSPHSWCFPSPEPQPLLHWKKELVILWLSVFACVCWKVFNSKHRAEWTCHLPGSVHTEQERGKLSIQAVHRMCPLMITGRLTGCNTSSHLNTLFWICLEGRFWR